MIHRLLAVFMLTGALGAWSAPPEQVHAPDYTTALALAKKRGAPIYIYRYGSDWSKLGDLFKEEVWEAPEFLNRLPGNAVLLGIDMLEHPPEAGEARARYDQLADKNKACPFTSINLPAIGVVNAQGQMIGRVDGLRPGDTVPDVIERLEQSMAELAVRASLFERGMAAEGMERTRFLGEWLRAGGGTRAQEKKVLAEIKKNDPGDQLGYVRMTTIGTGFHAPKSPPQMEREINEAVAAGDYEGALAKLEPELADPRNALLSPEQQQYLHFLRFKIFRAWPAYRSESVRTLRRIIDIKPDSVMAVGCKGYLMRTGDGPASITFGCWPRHLATGTVEIDEDAGRFFDHAGPYRVTLKIKNVARQKIRDNLSVQAVRLVADGQVVAEARGIQSLGKPPKGAFVKEVSYRIEMPEYQAGARYGLRILTDGDRDTVFGLDVRVVPLLPPLPED
jgi:hypothetical protein